MKVQELIDKLGKIDPEHKVSIACGWGLPTTSRFGIMDVGTSVGGAVLIRDERDREWAELGKNQSMVGYKNWKAL